jgi:hypothetical protein
VGQIRQAADQVQSTTEQAAIRFGGTIRRDALRPDSHAPILAKAGAPSKTEAQRIQDSFRAEADRSLRRIPKVAFRHYRVGCVAVDAACSPSIDPHHAQTTCRLAG